MEDYKTCYFLFTWYKKKDKIERHNTISIYTDADDIGYKAKSAMNVFCNNYGSLKYNEVVSIQELDENKQPVGEPIVPMNDTQIVPYKK